DAPFDLIAFYGVTKLFGYTDSEAHMICFRIVCQVDYKLSVCKRFSFFENELKIFFPFNSVSFLHHQYALSYDIPLYKIRRHLKNIPPYTKKKITCSDDLGVLG